MHALLWRAYARHTSASLPLARGALPCAVVAFAGAATTTRQRSSHPAQALLSHFDYFFSFNFHFTSLRFICQLAPTFHSSLLLHFSVTLTGLPSALRRPGNVPQVIISIATRGRISYIGIESKSLHHIDAYSSQPANADFAKAQFSAR